MPNNKLIFVDGGTRGFDLDKVDIGHLYKPTFSGGVRCQELWLFQDDRESKQREVLVVNHYTTLSGRRSKNMRSSTLKLTTIFGYDPEKGVWGPTERTRYMDIEWANAKRLVEETTTFVTDNLTPCQSGHTFYYRRR